MLQSPEAQLAYLGFQLIQPSPPLMPYVRSYWYFRREARLNIYHEEAMHPTGGYGILFNFGDRLSLEGDPLNPPVLLDGTNTVSRRLGFIGQVDLMGIRFREGGAFPILGIPLFELRNALNVLDALSDASLLRLHSQLSEVQALPDRVNFIEDWLLKRLSLGRERSVLIPASLARLRGEIVGVRQGYQLSSIPQVVHDLNISQRQLEHLYQTQVGITPKEYIRLQRVEIARLALKQQKQSNTRLAADLGYHDQAHFIRDFKAVVGLTPYSYMLRKHRASTTD